MNVLIACGGTGGHVFPAISLADRLKKDRVDIVFVGTRRSIEDEIRKKGYRLEALPVGVISFHSIRCGFNSAKGLIRSFFRAQKILKEIKPDVVVGFGGYVSGPVVLAAHFRNIPTLIHEQNVMPGKANYILSKFVDRVAVSFSGSRRYFKSENTVLTGCPVRPEIMNVKREEALRLFDFSENKFTLLVVGGSQGAHQINKVFLGAVNNIEEKNKLQIIHICGNQDYEFVRSAYEDLGVSAKVFNFFDQMGAAYSVADLVICRAGASTLSELAALGIASIIIPYPYAHQHQKANARALSDNGAAILIEESQLNSEILKEKINYLFRNREIWLKMKSKAAELGRTDALDNLALEVLSLGSGAR